MRTNCVVDGDTIWHEGVKIRLLGINAPEVDSPACTYEAELGQRASLRLQTLINQGPFTLERQAGPDEDHYGRKLRRLTRDGQNLGDILIEEGLAREWTGRRRGWC